MVRYSSRFWGELLVKFCGSPSGLLWEVEMWEKQDQTVCRREGTNMNEIAALLTSFSHLQNIAKAMLNLRDMAKLNEKIIELQSAIITAQQQAIAIQQSHATLETKTRDLEAECMRLKDWSAEKQNYICRQIASGIFAYLDNGVVHDFQKAHKYCCNCFDQGQKSLLQESHEPPGRVVHCPRCKFKTKFTRYWAS